MIRPGHSYVRELLHYRLRRAFRLETELAHAASHVEQLCPPETITGRPALCLPGQLDRVQQGAFGRNIRTEIAEVQGAPRLIRATQKFTAHNVVLYGSNLYCAGHTRYFALERRAAPDPTPRADIMAATIVSSFVGCYFFGDWLKDDCPTYFLASQDHPVVAMPSPPWADKAAYESWFGVHTHTPNYAYIREATFFDDIHQNQFKRQRVDALRAQLRDRFEPKGSAKIVYIRRGSGGADRAFINESEVVSVLERHGVTIVHAEQMTTDSLVRELLDCDMVIGVEGSQLSHAIYTIKARGSVVVIQPPMRFYNSHMDWARMLDMRYGVVIGIAQDGGFTLPPDDLLKTIDLF